ncbi:AAA family ATPase [Bradyrhizobium sp. BRP14]|nr:AAA family ATPase [Bradyrhizobium sp. BRP14]
MKVIYMTGAPASGKSTTARLLKEKLEGLKVWEYGAELTRYVQERPQVTTQEDLRRLSGNVVTPDDVAAVDQKLLGFVKANRGLFPVVIDSHPVTKEDYGYRITAFSADQVRALAPDEIWVLFTSPDIAVERINANAAGRPQIDLEQARMHTDLQASVAATYGIVTGRPVYLFDSGGDQQTLIGRLAERLKK